MTNENSAFPSDRLIMQLGAILLLLGLLTGLTVPLAEIPRMALTSHLEGVLNGMLLMVLGLTWTRLALGARQRAIAFWAIIYAAFANWAATLISAFTGAAAMMPLAGGGSTGSPLQEAIVIGLLLSLTLTILIGVGLVVYGLRRTPDKGEYPESEVRQNIQLASCELRIRKGHWKIYDSLKPRSSGGSDLPPVTLLA